MKKSSFLFLLSFCFALPAFAQNAAQTSQTVKTIDTPAQVTVTINNTTTAQGNTQTTSIENSPQQTATATATATAASPKTVQDTASGTTSLFGNYASSPYQSNIQVEMLRNTVWGSLVPRKKLYDDPAKGSVRYAGSTSKSTKKSSKKSASGQITAGAITTGANSVQNGMSNAQQTILVEQKDGQLCIPLDQFEQKTEAKTEQKPSQNASGKTASSFYTPTTQSPAMSTSPAAGVNAASPAAGSPANQNNTANLANGANASVNLVNNGVTNSATPASPAQKTVNGANQNTSPVSDRDIFAIPPKPFNPVSPSNSASPSNPAITGNALNPANPLGQAGQNPMARDPLAPQVPTGGSSGRNISVTPNNLGTPNS